MNVICKRSMAFPPYIQGGKVLPTFIAYDMQFPDICGMGSTEVRAYIHLANLLTYFADHDAANSEKEQAMKALAAELRAHLEGKIED